MDSVSGYPQLPAIKMHAFLTISDLTILVLQILNLSLRLFCLPVYKFMAEYKEQL